MILCESVYFSNINELVHVVKPCLVVVWPSGRCDFIMCCACQVMFMVQNITKILMNIPQKFGSSFIIIALI